MNKKLGIQRWIVLCSVFLYCFACVLPIFNEDYTPGIMALLQGWMGILGGLSPVLLSWLANIAYFIALLLPLHRRTAKTGFSIASLLLGLVFLGVKKIPIDEGGQDLEVTPGIAFYLWMASFILLAVFIFIAPKKAGKQPGS